MECAWVTVSAPARGSTYDVTHGSPLLTGQPHLCGPLRGPAGCALGGGPGRWGFGECGDFVTPENFQLVLGLQAEGAYVCCRLASHACVLHVRTRVLAPPHSPPRAQAGRRTHVGPRSAHPPHMHTHLDAPTHMHTHAHPPHMHPHTSTCARTPTDMHTQSWRNQRWVQPCFFPIKRLNDFSCETFHFGAFGAHAGVGEVSWAPWDPWPSPHAGPPPLPRCHGMCAVARLRPGPAAGVSGLALEKLPLSVRGRALPLTPTPGLTDF